jgi:hypothetical protein
MKLFLVKTDQARLGLVYLLNRVYRKISEPERYETVSSEDGPGSMELVYLFT